MLGYPCVVVAELLDVYEGFGDREDKGRMVARGGVCVYKEGVGDGVFDLGYLDQKGCVVAVFCGVVVVVGGDWGVSFGMRISQWSNGELV